ncbi:amino acid transporter (plasmid) [Agrobacterium tumefaciens]|uniref:Amino acid transporter n=1 Tax=Agrobacterium tumefaciens TaxID=358 RepID=A0AAP9EA97_AGRTU|nr:amino acid transporter [Agrobacterium tumefaciens]NSZ61090.1 amino acid transporter [Agrobacterium tumefaciens]QDY97511.1 amino acid transporter [Agrobacterium tumefaciens]UXS12639.1 amino acid transporter [Agrobacterium tumefaciens]UXS20000.1 amino acid transporter [Agrobacterium tumefaciens]UXS27648.1 amino acid transporter [Agrobacterium tumefaciens]
MQPPPDDAWEAWSPEELVARLGRADTDWYIVGGWALDLWHGEQTRAHEDLEFSVPACQAQGYRSVLSDLEFFTARDGKLDHLPRVEPLPEDVWQLWGADIGAGRWRVDMMVDRGSLDMWVYKRDPSLTLPRAKAIRATAGGIRYLAPHIVLLFKARHAREKDDQDFRNALPRLESTERSALHRWLEALHPGHAWIQELRPG